jgi:hypothetical protein
MPILFLATRKDLIRIYKIVTRKDAANQLAFHNLYRIKNTIFVTTQNCIYILFSICANSSLFLSLHKGVIVLYFIFL